MLWGVPSVAAALRELLLPKTAAAPISARAGRSPRLRRCRAAARRPPTPAVSALQSRPPFTVAFVRLGFLGCILATADSSLTSAYGIGSATVASPLVVY